MSVILSFSPRPFLLFLLSLYPLVAAAQFDEEYYSALVEQIETTKGLPKPVLMQMISEGVNLEQAAAISVASSDDASYAEAYTYYAICMSINETQAEEVHDIVVQSARETLKANVLAEAHFALEHYLTNRCEGVERLTRLAPDEDGTTENTVGGRASISL